MLVMEIYGVPRNHKPILKFAIGDTSQETTKTNNNHEIMVSLLKQRTNQTPTQGWA